MCPLEGQFFVLPDIYPIKPQISSSFPPFSISFFGQDYKWGFQIGEDEQRHQWFKLDLDPSHRRDTSQLARLFPDPKAAPPGYDMHPEKLSTDYFTAIRKHGEQILRCKLPSSALQSLPIEYIVSLMCSPAGSF